MSVSVSDDDDPVDARNEGVVGVLATIASTSAASDPSPGPGGAGGGTSPKSSVWHANVGKRPGVVVRIRGFPRRTAAILRWGRPCTRPPLYPTSTTPQILGHVDVLGEEVT